MEWGELPTVVLIEVYKYLPIRDRLNASSVCRNWRLPGFQVPLSDHLNLRLEEEGDIPRFRFLTHQFVHKVSHVTLSFGLFGGGGGVPSSRKQMYLDCLDLLEETLVLIETNNSIKTLKLFCSENSVAGALNQNVDTNALITTNYFTKKVINPLQKVLAAKNKLETFSFPLIQNLSSFGNNLFLTLSDKKSHSIQNLFIASIPTVPVLEANCSSLVTPGLELNNRINGFVNLQMLSIEHDILTDQILAKIGVGNLGGGLQRLSLVAGIENPNVSNQGWTNLVVNNPQCKVRLTIIDSSVISNPSSNLLFPSIPVSHFRSYCCKGMRIHFLNSLVQWNVFSLEHLELVDEDYDWEEFLGKSEADTFDATFMDPIIYASWRCENLHTVKLGVLYCGHSLLGIAKLRAASLRCLEIPSSQIGYHSLKKLKKVISKALKRPWKPVPDSKKKNQMQDSQRSLCQTLRALQSDEA